MLVFKAASFAIIAELNSHYYFGQQFQTFSLFCKMESKIISVQMMSDICLLSFKKFVFTSDNPDTSYYSETVELLQLNDLM